MGVGSAGIAGSLFGSPFVAEMVPNWVPIGVFGDASGPSSTWDTERLRLFRFLRLDEEKFFRIPDLDCARPGEPERGREPALSSKLKLCESVGVGGEATSVGKGEEVLRVRNPVLFTDCGIGGGGISIFGNENPPAGSEGTSGGGAVGA